MPLISSHKPVKYFSVAQTHRSKRHGLTSRELLLSSRWFCAWIQASSRGPDLALWRYGPREPAPARDPSELADSMLKPTLVEPDENAGESSPAWTGHGTGKAGGPAGKGNVRAQSNRQGAAAAGPNCGTKRKRAVYTRRGNLMVIT